MICVYAHDSLHVTGNGGGRPDPAICTGLSH
jgi:hypothetical protein